MYVLIAVFTTLKTLVLEVHAELSYNYTTYTISVCMRVCAVKAIRSPFGQHWHRSGIKSLLLH